MQLITDWETLELRDVVLTIGNFDGVHRGHQAILAEGRIHADAAGVPLVLMSFDPHPLALLSPQYVPAVLTQLSEKLHWLKHYGVDICVLVKTSPAFLAMSADDFVRLVIMARFCPTAIVEGPTFNYGHGREGNVHSLATAGQTHGFEVQIVEPTRVPLGGHPGTVISSSLIRQLLISGTVDQAATCLGRPYALLGQVEHGTGRGKRLGIPTANVHVEGQLIPAEGVYAAQAEVRSHRYAAAVSIGRTPTFNGQQVTVEAHLIGYQGDLYEQPIRIDFIAWLRGQQHFPSSATLVEQIERDVARTRDTVATYFGPPPLV